MDKRSKSFSWGGRDRDESCGGGGMPHNALLMGKNAHLKAKGKIPRGSPCNCCLSRQGFVNRLKPGRLGHST